MSKEIERTHGLSVGDCLKSVWGHDQTNVDYYQVIALNGRTMVTVRKIAGAKTATNKYFLVGTCSPMKNEFVGPEFRAKPGGYSDGGKTKDAITLTSYSCAVRCSWDDVSRWSSYA